MGTGSWERLVKDWFLTLDDDDFHFWFDMFTGAFGSREGVTVASHFIL